MSSRRTRAQTASKVVDHEVENGVTEVSQTVTRKTRSAATHVKEKDEMEEEKKGSINGKGKGKGKEKEKEEEKVVSLRNKRNNSKGKANSRGKKNDDNKKIRNKKEEESDMELENKGKDDNDNEDHMKEEEEEMGVKIIQEKTQKQNTREERVQRGKEKLHDKDEEESIEEKEPKRTEEDANNDELLKVDPCFEELLAPLEEELQHRIEMLRTEGNQLVIFLESQFKLELLKIPKNIKSMKMKDFCEKYNKLNATKYTLLKNDLQVNENKLSSSYFTANSKNLPSRRNFRDGCSNVGNSAHLNYRASTLINNNDVTHYSKAQNDRNNMGITDNDVFDYNDEENCPTNTGRKQKNNYLNTSKKIRGEKANVVDYHDSQQGIQSTIVKQPYNHHQKRHGYYTESESDTDSVATMIAQTPLKRISTMRTGTITKQVGTSSAANYQLCTPGGLKLNIRSSNISNVQQQNASTVLQEIDTNTASRRTSNRRSSARANQSIASKRTTSTRGIRRSSRHDGNKVIESELGDQEYMNNNEDHEADTSTSMIDIDFGNIVQQGGITNSQLGDLGGNMEGLSAEMKEEAARNLLLIQSEVSALLEQLQQS